MTREEAHKYIEAMYDDTDDDYLCAEYVAAAFEGLCYSGVKTLFRGPTIEEL